MKKYAFLLAILGFSALGFSQTRTLFGDLRTTGAFGSPILEVGAINKQTGSDVGGGGALVMEYLFVGGYGMGTDYPTYNIADGPNQGDYNLKFGHGGFWLGLTPALTRIVHPYASLRLGRGKARMRQDGDDIFSDRIFVTTPEVGFEINITDFFRLAVSGGYRWVNGVGALPGLNNDAFSSPIGLLTFRFGGFGDDDDDDFDFNWD
jgi:hypothetical protein